MPRKFPRKELIGRATITTQASILKVHVTDISCDGMSIMEVNQGEINELNLGESVNVSITIDGKKLVFLAKVVWIKPLGAGITIEQIDEDNFSGWLKILNIAFKS